MKTLYIDCPMGAAGDMLSAALYEIMPDRDSALSKLNSLGIPGVEFIAEPSEKCGITGTHMTVKVHGEEESEHMHHHEHEHIHGHEHEHEHGHHHAGMEDIRKIVGGMNAEEKIKEDVMKVYRLIAEAESRVHGKPVELIHFHEVGAMDAVADIAAVCLMMNELSPERITVSPVNVGSGTVKCAHGILPVPAPATALLLKDVPIYSNAISGELCTPTGAALLKYFADGFGNMPVTVPEKIGYGMGKKDFPAANCVRVILGNDGSDDGTVYELKCNLDDMTPEALGYAMDVLFKEGALDAFTEAVGMKKSRSGVMLTVLCREKDREKMVRLIFKHTSTIGIREIKTRRYVLDRQTEEVESPYGKLRIKVSLGYGVKKVKPEFEDVREIAEKNGISIEDVVKSIK